MVLIPSRGFAPLAKFVPKALFAFLCGTGRTKQKSALLQQKTLQQGA